MVLLALPIFAVGAVWCAPIVLSQPMLAEQVIPRAIPGFDGQIALGSASLGWLSPLELHDVSVRDRQGDLLFQAGSVSSSKTLLELLTGYPRFGAFQVERPEVRIALRDQGSNFEDAFASLLGTHTETDPHADGGASDLEYSLTINEGTIEFVDVAGGRKQRLENVSLTLEQGPAPQPMKLSLQAANAGAEGSTANPGRLDLQVELRSSEQPAVESSEPVPHPSEAPAVPPTAQITSHPALAEHDTPFNPDAVPPGPADTEAWQAHLKVERFDLGGLDPVFARFAPGTHLEAQLDGDVTVLWIPVPGSPQLHAEGKLTAQDLAVQTSHMHNTEKVRLPTLELSGTVDLRDHRLEARQLALKSELATLETSGTIGTAVLFKSLSLDAALASLGNEDFRCDADLNLARILAYLPRTLRLRDGVQIDSGMLTIIIESRMEKDRRLWLGQVSTENLAGKIHGQPLSFNKPVEVTFAAHLEGHNATLDRLLCKSAYVQLLASGRQEQGMLRARADLDGLLKEMERYVDLSGIHAAGRLNTKLTWNMPPSGRIEVQAQALAEQFALVIPGLRAWHESRLEFGASATGEMPAHGARQLDECIMQLTSGGDRCLVELQHAVPFDDPAVHWPFRLEVEGEMASWLSRLQAWVPLHGWDVRGHLHAEAKLNVSRENVACEDLQVRIQQLMAAGQGYRIDEPALQLQAGGAWQLRESRLTVPAATLSGSSVSLRAKDLIYRSAPAGMPEFAGKLALRADLARVGEWSNTGPNTGGARFTGVAKGMLTVDQTQTHLHWDAQLTGENVALMSAMPDYGASPSSIGALQVAAAGDYERQTDLLTVSKLELLSDGAQLSGTGHVTSLGRLHGAEPMIELSGHLTYDLERLIERFRGVVGPNVHWVGRESRPFSLRGPLSFAQHAGVSEIAARGNARGRGTASAELALVGQAGIGWSSANAYGLAIGPGELDVSLSQGVLQVAPLDLSVAEGRLKMAPRVVFATTPSVLELNKGPLLEQMHLSSQLCAGWLKFVTPMLADATVAEGRFSLNLDGASLPLSNMQGGDLGGNLLIHTAQIKPAAMGGELLTITRQLQTILKTGSLGSGFSNDLQVDINNQNVEFRMTQGRIYHRGLEFHIGRITVRTSGSVGFDETVSLVAEIPVLNDWVGNNPLLAGLKGQVLRVPINGTLKSPQMDPSVFASLAQQLAGKAVESAVGGAVKGAVDKNLGNVGKELEKLLPF